MADEHSWKPQEEDEDELDETVCTIAWMQCASCLHI